jgi:AcrR family transcriptional regulator
MSVVPEVRNPVGDEALVQRRLGQITEAAVELFATRGYYNTTILDVAKKAGVSSGLIYRYVNDKEDVLQLALLSVLERYREEIPRALEGRTDPLERWFAAVRAYCQVIDQNRIATVLAYRSTKSLPPERREGIKQLELETNGLLSACVRDCVAAGLFRPVNVGVVTYQFVAFAHTWALKHWRLKELCTFEEYVASGIELFAHGLFTQKGWRHYRKLLAGTAGPAHPSPPRREAGAAGERRPSPVVKLPDEGR